MAAHDRMYELYWNHNWNYFTVLLAIIRCGRLLGPSSSIFIDSNDKTQCVQKILAFLCHAALLPIQQQLILPSLISKPVP